VKVDFMKASSYGAASESSGDVTVKGASNLAKWDNYNMLLVSCSVCWCAAPYARRLLCSVPRAFGCWATGRALQQLLRFTVIIDPLRLLHS
jgi:hypothetical protein